MLSFPAMSIEEADEIIAKVPGVVLVIVDGVTRNEDGTKLAFDVKKLERLIIKWPDLRFIFLVSQLGIMELPPTDRARIIHEPFNHKTLALMTRRLIGIPERTYYKTLVQFKRLSESVPKGLFGFSVNIEPAGLLLQTETMLQIGEAVGLSFIPPNGGRNVDVKGIVVRETESSEKGTKRFGIKLGGLSPALKEAISDFCLPKSQL
ncbi:MAG: hypothetical protein A2294_01210 [Candidatus Magasanikbacteria bacterium RIFOXYB2_FULL_38_10]|nr:MAG: hypothetical protein A2294_01210 [Candidatus Magasanikbacteria bacterium RIFOXYB2_FULL_38_10]